MAPALPSCGEAGLPGGVGGPGLPEDVAAVRQVLRAGDEPTVVVAHGYGGIVTAEAAAGAGRCATCCWSPATCQVGQSLSDFGHGSPAPFLSQPEAVRDLLLSL
ncbi:MULTISPECIES: alpha/beta hydrolase [Streptomyces]|uniref:alpha/beta hydrolase n=1 Tax=Streptomyces TaxID=1883 RepID=UPI000A9E2E0B|nr:alpha/beta hydrolase [Streptomyces melanosporofaciens]